MRDEDFKMMMAFWERGKGKGGCLLLHLLVLTRAVA